MTIIEIYAQYRIMPNLQQHQLRVAGVAQVVCQHIANQVPALPQTEIVQAALLHDMGNIIKFDLTRFPEFLEPEGVEYWQQVQAEFVAKYGNNEHEATRQIVHEIGVSDLVAELIASISFTGAAQVAAQSDPKWWIAEYADCRVTPEGVTDLETRLLDLETRYGSKYPSEAQQQKRHETFAAIRAMERNLVLLGLQPKAITESAVQRILPELRTCRVP